jgi:Cu-Zn family superoxide dismutase
MICQNFIATFKENVKGYVKFHQCNPGKIAKVIFNLYGLQPNSKFAIHIHEFGDMTDGCNSLGSHLNLTNKEHGSIFIDIKNSHTGDLINNIFTDQKGEFKYEYYDQRLNLFESVNKNIIGCSVVIHYGIDDYGLGNNSESKKTGNAGGRMDCAVIGKMKNI